MTERTSLSIPWLDLVINSNWWPVLLPLGYGLFRFGEYLLKRRLEKQPENEAIDQGNHQEQRPDGVTWPR